MSSMVSQNAIPSRKHLGGYQPYVFTEQGVAMLATVLNSERAIQANIAIIRVFVKLREMLSTHKELAHKLAELEIKIEGHDEEIRVIFDAIRQLMAQPEPKEKKIGFRVRERGTKYRTSRRRDTEGQRKEDMTPDNQFLNIGIDNPKPLIPLFE